MASLVTEAKECWNLQIKGNIYWIFIISQGITIKRECSEDILWHRTCDGSLLQVSLAGPWRSIFFKCLSACKDILKIWLTFISIDFKYSRSFFTMWVYPIQSADSLNRKGCLNTQEFCFQTAFELKIATSILLRIYSLRACPMNCRLASSYNHMSSFFVCMYM